MLFSFFGWLVDLVSGEWWTYALVFGLATLDAVLPVLPSESVVILAAIVAADGTLSIWGVVAAAAVGAVLGDNVSYLLGRRIGEPAYRGLFSGEESRRRYEWARRVLGRHGAWIVPAARFVPGGRTATTFAAGAVAMRYRTFIAVDAVGGLAWAAYGGALGYLGGRSFAAASWKSFALSFGIAGAIALAGLVYWRVEERRGE